MKLVVQISVASSHLVLPFIWSCTVKKFLLSPVDEFKLHLLFCLCTSLMVTVDNVTLESIIKVLFISFHELYMELLHFTQGPV